MFVSILALTIRKFFKNLSYSFVILSGLVVGITTVILVFLWATYELDFDRYHPDNERVFAVLMNEAVDGDIETSEETPVPLADYLATSIPEVESFTRIDNTRRLLGYGTKALQKRGVYADTGYFKVFQPVMIAGDAMHPMPDNHSIVISKTLAQLLFGDNDALGKIIMLDRTNELKVTGVFSGFPENSSLRSYEFVLPFHAKPREEDEWQNYYVKLNAASAREAVERKIDARFKEFFGNQNATSLLFCLTDWRLHWSFENGKVSGGRIVYVVIFGITALFILMMSAINYVNIMTASAAKRAREIGVRKMTGATQRTLIGQFMTESLFTTLMATLVSLGIAYLLLPVFNLITGAKLSMSLTDPKLLLGLSGIALFTGLVAGSYPAFLLSSLKPALVLKQHTMPALTGATFRRSLVIFQFTLSVILIFSAVVMRQQTTYLLKKDLGFDKNNVINIWLSPDFNLPLQNFKAEILDHSSVLSAGLGGASPMEINGYAEVRWAGKRGEEPTMLNGVSCDHDMLSALRFEFVQGRNFSRQFASDSAGFIINQKAADLLGFSDPVGQTITYTMFGEQQGTIIGVVKDFHNEDIHAPMGPVIFTLKTEEELYNLFILYADGQQDQALAHVKAVFDKFQPGIPLPYSFLDSDFEHQFYQEKLLGNLSVWFTVIALVIAGLGLLGLTMFNTQRRTKEIGVRKVLGASVSQILIMLCSGAVRPVLISFVVAFPIGSYLMEEFLAGYAFRISVSAITFILVAAAMIGFVLLTVLYLSFLAAVKNPVESLKTE
ncbi:ABC transporter permease [Fulvivirgaceae bacterium PWU4]|uniref:ABC transporter permease n=1 Tax=Chryseosolibacter histidini TaxID=2782349 RepID=A0AAP2DLP4_9BACT|nr:ABC transporter permease [Chryseosolibacter histidini]MBT1698671.1 ABC transporter permease [Chryseosolibacter histidini]